MSCWTVLTLGELLSRDGGSLKTGPFGTTLKASEYSNYGVPLISVSEVGYGALRVSLQTPRASPELVERLPEYVLRTGDVVFGRKGAVDRSALIKPDQDGWFLGSDGIRLRPPSSCDPRFLAYVFQLSETKAWLTQHATGTTMASLSQGVIQGVPILLPPLTEQRAIAHVLGTLDDKIELNRRMNETLEEMARSLFKSWFVDFDPVRAKTEGRDTGLPPHIADLFPDSFEPSELGEIPAGWGVCGLDEIATFRNGLALQKYPPEHDRILPVIKIAQLRSGNTANADIASADIPAEYVVEDGDVLFSWSGSLECDLWSGGTGALNQHLFKVTSDRYPKWFYYHWVHRHLPEFRHTAAGKATTMGHIQRHHLSDAEVILPPESLIATAEKFLAPLVESIWQREVQSRSLGELRDTLLPKLMSGEIRVGEAEREVEAVR